MAKGGDGDSEGGSEDVSGGGTATATSEYSVTDPGYDLGFEADSESEDSTSELESLKAENTKTPSAKADDAGEETAEEEADSEADEGSEKAPEAANPKGISDELLDRATELGYTFEELKRFRSEKSLEKEVSRVERLQQRLQERQQKGSQKPAEKEQEAAEEEAEPDWAAMIEAGHDPDIVATHQKTWQRATAAESLMKQLAKADQQRAFEAQCERFDESLNSLGEEYESLLGKGRKADLQKSSPEAAANRQIVFGKVAMLRNSYQMAGVSVPPEADLIQEAVQAAFWKHSKTIARKEITGQIRKAGSQALSRPHSTGRQALSGQELASAKERDFWKKFG